MRDLQRLRLAQEPRARPFPVALAVRAAAAGSPRDAPSRGACRDRPRCRAVPGRAARRSRTSTAARTPREPSLMTVPRSPSAALSARPNSAMSLHRSSGILRERAADGHVQPGRQIRPQRRRARHRRVEVAVQHAQRIVAGIRHAAGQHLEHDRAEAVDVRARVDDRRRQLLGRGVCDRSDELVRPGQPRVRRSISRMFARPKSTSL